MSANTKVVSIRLSIEEADLFDQIEKETGIDKKHLIKNQILNPNNNQNTSNINFEQEIQKLSYENKKSINDIKNTMGDIFETSMRNLINSLDTKRLNDAEVFLFQKMYELKLTDQEKQNVSSYKKGDVIITAKNNLLAITNINQNEISVAKLPITNSSEKHTLPFEDLLEGIVETYRF